VLRPPPRLKADQFPKPIELGVPRMAWAEDEIDAHLEELVARRSAASVLEPENKEGKSPA